MGGGKASFTEHSNYPKETEIFLSRIRSSNARTSITDEKYISEGGWNARKNGQFLTDNTKNYNEATKNGEIIIDISDPKTDWKEWIKTLGNLSENGNNYTISFRGHFYSFTCVPNKKGYSIKLPEKSAKENPLFGKLFKYSFRKAAYCVVCKTCQAICKNGRISFDNGLHIENCKHCFDCHSMEGGCLAYHSLNIPNVENKMKSLNTFSNHAPKTEWLKEFFEKLTDFLENNTLGRVQKPFYKRFLKDAGLIEKNEATRFSDIGTAIGWDTDTFLGLMIVNLVANNPQIEWYVQKMDIGRANRRIELEDTLTAEGQSKDNISSIINAFKRLNETPFGTVLHFGYISDDGDLMRTKCSVSDPRVVLYGLFKFAEKCNDFKEFNLATLLNDSIDRDGVSPTRIFGLDRDEMTPLLLGLSARYPEFITASFTHDLEKITLSKDKTSSDILELF
jgi:phosphoadenosine phosphosulfate reductase